MKYLAITHNPHDPMPEPRIVYHHPTTEKVGNSYRVTFESSVDYGGLSEWAKRAALRGELLLMPEDPPPETKPG